MKISVVGGGYVGLVSAGCLAEGGNHVICVDNDKARIDKLKRGKIPIYEPGLTDIIARNITAKRLVFTTDIKLAVQESLVIFIAVGTPPNDDGSADTSALLQVLGEIAALTDDYRIIVVKSTVPAGTCKAVCKLMAEKTNKPFDYVSNPEFLKESSAVEDFLKPDRVIIGTTNPAVKEIMKQLYAPFMRKNRRMICMDPVSAEITKYAANSMLATRISFMNEMSIFCDQFGADIEMVREGIGSDSRIGNGYLFPGIGYGGSCFPKDIRALIKMGDENGCSMGIIKAVDHVNYKQHDRFAERVLKYFKDTDEQITLGVWGLAFKAKTDDIRQSPAIYCLRKFIDAGIKIKAYDPQAMPESKAELSAEPKSSPHRL